jgi:hypothetical protein
MSIYLANLLTTNFGMVPVGFGLMATAGTFLAGACFVLRDAVQDGLGKLWVVALILVGAALSFIQSAPMIAVASAAAFLISEAVDFAIYTPLRERGYIRAALASNIAGAFLDTVVFLSLAGFPVWSSVPGQMVAKVAVTAAVVVPVGVARAVFRKSLN